MEFSGQELEDLQRAAGLLGLTVDELVRLRRRPFPSPGMPVPVRDLPHQTAGSSAFYQAPPPPHQSYVVDFSQAGGQGFVGLADPWMSSQESLLPGISHPRPLLAQSVNTEVILLNPQTAWYDCNMDFADFAGVLSRETPSANAGSSSESLDLEQGSFVHVPAVAAESDAESESTAREEADDVTMEDAGADWSVVLAPGASAASSGGSASPDPKKRRYQSIAPRPGSTTSSPSSKASSTSHKVRKRRSPYQQSSKDDTNLTRQLNACVRCRMQRNRVGYRSSQDTERTDSNGSQCIPDERNPRGPCKTCQQKTARMSRLPCLRYKITDSTLFRTGLDYMPFYRNHPMTGPAYGDFHLYGEVQWTGAPSRFLSLGQLGGAHFEIELEEFTPTSDLSDVDLKGRPIFAVPWAISDPEAAVVAMNQYIDDNLGAYLETYLDDSDSLVWDIFHAAYRASVFPAPVPLLARTLRLWCVCRFIESRWRCWGDDEIRAANPQDPFYDWDSPPPYLDYQLASIIIHRILGPLREEVLRDLQNVVNEHRPQDWYITFLCSFILLQNYEIQMRFQEQFASRRNALVCPPLPPRPDGARS